MGVCLEEPAAFSPLPNYLDLARNCTVCVLAHAQTHAHKLWDKALGVQACAQFWREYRRLICKQAGPCPRTVHVCLSLVVVMEFSLDSLDELPEDSDVLDPPQEHVTDTPAGKASPKAHVQSKDKEDATVSDLEHKEECCDLNMSPETEEKKGRIDDIDSDTLFIESRKVPESKISLKKCQETSSDVRTVKCESPVCSTPEIADFAIMSQKHRYSDLKLISNCAASNSSRSQTDQREDLIDLPELATPTRGDTFVGVVSHHHDLSPWERWVVQKAHQERERREGKKLSDVSIPIVAYTQHGSCL